MDPVKVEISRRDECHTWPAKNDYFKLGGSLHGSIHGSMTGNNIFDSNDIESFWRRIGVPMPTQNRCNDLLPGFETDQTHLMELTMPGMKDSETMRLPGGVPMLPQMPPEWSHLTTMMMRNLPNKYTQRMLLTEVNQSGFLGTIDFFYLPIDQETNANRGYGFLNFIAPYYAWAFRNMFEGRRMSRFNSAKFVSVTPATLQGFQANYAHYSNARCNRGDPSSRPLFLREPSPELKLDSSNDTQEKGNSKPRQRKGKLFDVEKGKLGAPPKARLDKKSIDAGNYQQQYNQYKQHQQESSEATTTAQDSQESNESLESQESQSSHSDSREDSTDGNVKNVKSRQQSRQVNQRQKQQAQQQKKAENQKQNQKKQNQQQSSKPSIHQHKKTQSAVNDGPYFIEMNNGATIMSNGTYGSYSSGLSRPLGGLDSLSGYPTQFDTAQYAGLNMGSRVPPQQWSSPDLSCRPPPSSVPGLSPVFREGPFAFVNVGPTSGICSGQNFKQGEKEPQFCPQCGGCIKPKFQFCPHCGSGLALLGQN